MASSYNGLLSERFARKYIKTATCWEWVAAKNAKGYGKFSTKRSVWEYAHRISYLLYKGDFDQKLLICHKCDNTSCVNPDHLFVGTYSDNNKDAFDKGRHTNPILIGDKNPRTKLTEKQVDEILIRIQRGENLKDFYMEYKVDRTTVYKRVKQRR